MKKITLLIAFLVGLHWTAFSQGCLPGTSYFSSQAEVDAFQTNYPGCTQIEGNIVINGNDITHLNAFSNVTSIEGFFYITNASSLTNLTGLDALTLTHPRL
ncbi:MAG: hypothetical protein Q8O72_02095 [Bacteroidales bacterium]|nr:hypothetical protein [Bacteroidales bacterium]